MILLLLTPDEMIMEYVFFAYSFFSCYDEPENFYQGGHVRGSHQWAAQTFYDDLPAFYENFKDVEKIVFYCSSSVGRGPRCGGWWVYGFSTEFQCLYSLRTYRYQDYLEAKGDQTNSTAYILEGGVKAWLKKFGDQEDLVDKD